MRERVYPAWVRAKKMSQEKSDRELATMRDVLATLEALQFVESNHAQVYHHHENGWACGVGKIGDMQWFPAGSPIEAAHSARLHIQAQTMAGDAGRT